LKRKLVEKFPEVQTPVVETDSNNEMLKGKEVIQSPMTTIFTKPTAPMKISSSRKKSSYV